MHCGSADSFKDKRDFHHFQLESPLSTLVHKKLIVLLSTGETTRGQTHDPSFRVLVYHLTGTHGSVKLWFLVASESCLTTADP